MAFTIRETPLAGLKTVEPQVHGDDRGFFMEVFRADQFEAAGLPSGFLQLNQSRSANGVVRGLHFQHAPPMGKLMRVSRGQAFLVAVDIRKGSPTLGRWHGLIASEDNKIQLWGGPGFARGFWALSDLCEIQYLCTSVYNPEGEAGIRWDDPDIGVDWPAKAPALSERDRSAPSFAEWLNSPQSDAFHWEGGA